MNMTLTNIKYDVKLKFYNQIYSKCFTTFVYQTNKQMTHILCDYIIVKVVICYCYNHTIDHNKRAL
jgi:hypothetical protein